MDIPVSTLVIMIATILAVIGAGIYYSRSIGSAAGYSVGGRSAGVLMVAGSIGGTIVGAGCTIGTAQMAFSAGLSAWWYTLGCGIAFIIMGLFYAKRLRTSGLETIPQYLGQKYGKKAEIISSVVTSIGILISAISSFLPGVEILSDILHISPVAASLIFLVLVIGYIVFGGMKSAAMGGILKMVIIWITLFGAGFIAWTALSDAGAISAFPKDTFNLFNRGLEPSLAHLFSMIVGIICTQSYIQCIFSASTPAKASAGCILAALIVIPVGLPSIAIGLYTSVFAPDTPSILVLPSFFLYHTGTILGGLAMGGLVLSLISSVGGLSLGMSTIIAKDLIAPFFRIKDNARLLFLIKSTLFCILILTCIAANLNRNVQILILNYLSMALRGSGIFIPLTLAVFWPGHLKKSWTVISMAASTIVAILTAVSVIPLSIDPLFAGLITDIICLIPGFRFHKISETA